MKLIACALPLVVSVPGVLSAQIKVGATLGPVAVVATFGGRGVTVRGTAEAARHSRAYRSDVREGTAGGSAAARVLATARRLVGTRYRYGGSTPGAGLDCSGFVQYVFRSNGIHLPRTSRQQAGAGRPVRAAIDALKPGDLMLFSSKGGGIDHVAIYAGNNRMLHSSAGAGKVVYDDLSTARGAWYLARHVTSRRVL